MPGYKRVILVTGSNTGMGFEMVRLLALRLEGHTVYLSSRDDKKGKNALSKILASPGLVGQVKYVQLDVTDQKSIDAAKVVIEKAEGRLDTLVNNAATARMDQPQSVTDVSIANIHACIESNFYGLVSVTQAFIPLLKASVTSSPGMATILNVTIEMASASFMSGLPRDNFLHRFVAYTSSKAAANSYTIALVKAFEGEIKVNAVSPGVMKTQLSSYREGGKSPEQGAQYLLEWALLDAEDKRTGHFVGAAGEMGW